MPSPSALLRGVVSRLLPQRDVDGVTTERALRMSQYGDASVSNVFNDYDSLCDEGAFFSAGMTPAQTALQVGIQSAYVATQAFIVLGNSDAPGGKKIFMDRIRLVCSVAGTSGVDLRYAIVLDNINRAPTTISSGSGGSGPGTAANQTAYRVPVSNTNMDVAAAAPVCVPYFGLGLAASTGAATVPAPSAAARVIVGNGMLKGSIPVVKDQYVLKFGNVEGGGTFQGAAALCKIAETVPPVILGPGQFLTFHIWSASNITAGNAFDDVQVCWYER